MNARCSCIVSSNPVPSQTAPGWLSPTQHAPAGPANNKASGSSEQCLHHWAASHSPWPHAGGTSWNPSPMSRRVRGAAESLPLTAPHMASASDPSPGRVGMRAARTPIRQACRRCDASQGAHVTCGAKRQLHGTGACRACCLSCSCSCSKQRARGCM